MDPIYIPGRFRTASSPSRMVIESALYSLLALFFWAATIDFVSCLEVTTPVGPLHNRAQRSVLRPSYWSAPTAPSFRACFVPSIYAVRRVSRIALCHDGLDTCSTSRRGDERSTVRVPGTPSGDMPWPLPP
ncbi:Uncharacterised protein [Mycobacteroides abscessus subsp. abscessus]|nr:Uncharacterised protein [Mycobacteroides abscessus subsp. abscessus]